MGAYIHRRTNVVIAMPYQRRLLFGEGKMAKARRSVPMIGNASVCAERRVSSTTR